MSSLKLKTVSGIKWQVVNKVSQKVISVGTFAVLARILDPSVFGLFALAFVVIDALQFFKAFGFDAALIQRQEDENFQKVLDTAFIVIQANGIVLCLLCFLLAPWSASYFKNPELLNITRALGLIFIFTCFSKVPTTLLQKHMKFNAIAWTEFISSVINSIIAIAIAFTTQSVWSLVIAYIAKQIFLSVTSWYLSGFRFTWKFEWKAVKELSHFGKYLMGMSVLWLINGKLNDVVVGRMLGATLLGYLVLAENIGNFINTHFTSLISSVMFPAYAKIQHDKDDLKKAYLKTIKYVSFFSAPFSIFLICFAGQFTHILYGQKWYDIIPLIKVFGVIQLISPILWCSGSLFMGVGKPNYTFNVTLASIVLRIPALILFIHWWGIFGSVIASLFLTIIFAPINIQMIKKLIAFKSKEFFAALFPFYSSAFIVFIAIEALLLAFNLFPNSVLLSNPFVQLSMGGLFGLVIYLLLAYRSDSKTFLDIKSMLIKKS